MTIDDVARLAEVHKATVSRAQRPDPRQVAETLSASSVRPQLGYVPNAMARGLRTSRSMTVGVIIPDLMNPIFPPIVRGIEHVLQPHGYTVLTVSADSHDDVEVSAFESLLQRRVDGFILATGRLDDQTMNDEATAAAVPVVLVNRDSGVGRYPVVSGNNGSGIDSAVTSSRHARAQSHRPCSGSAELLHNACSGGGVRCGGGYGGRATQHGLRRVVVDRGGLPRRGRVACRPHRAPHCADRGQRPGCPRPDRRLRANGLRCPEDVSVVGFNDMPFAEDFWPPLTTVHMPLREMGAEAAQLLLHGIEDGEQEAATLTLPVSLVVRASTVPAPELTRPEHVRSSSDSTTWFGPASSSPNRPRDPPAPGSALGPRWSRRQR